MLARTTPFPVVAGTADLQTILVVTLSPRIAPKPLRGDARPRFNLATIRHGGWGTLAGGNELRRSRSRTAKVNTAVNNVGGITTPTPSAKSERKRMKPQTNLRPQRWIIRQRRASRRRTRFGVCLPMRGKLLYQRGNPTRRFRRLFEMC